jgi:hypothetical protein
MTRQSVVIKAAEWDCLDALEGVFDGKCPSRTRGSSMASMAARIFLSCLAVTENSTIPLDAQAANCRW